MNKFRRFLDRIPAETCLKLDYFGNKSPSQARPGFDSLAESGHKALKFGIHSFPA